MTASARPWVFGIWLALWLGVAAWIWSVAWPQQQARGCWLGEWPFEAGCPDTPAGRRSEVPPAVLQQHLSANPGDSHAYARLLGTLWQQRDPAALALLPTAKTLAPVHNWALAVRAEAALATQNWPEAVTTLVALMERGQSSARAPLLQLMLAPETQPLALMALQPESRWLGSVLSSLDAKVPVGPLQPFVSRGLELGVLNPRTVLAMVDRLKREGNWLDAYTLWVAWLGEVNEGLFNGGFDRRALGRGFDWEWVNQPVARQGVRINQVSATPRPGSMLELEMTGRAALPTPLVGQTVVLLQPRYRLTGRWMSDRLRTRDGLVWALRCQDGRERWAQSEPLRDMQRQWREFSVEVQVPPECAGAVRLQLETTTPAEARMGMTGVVAVDDLVLTPISGDAS